MWVRATYPRLRIDQMMTFCWKVLVPALVGRGVAGCCASGSCRFRVDIQALLLSGSNIVALVVTLGIIGRGCASGWTAVKDALNLAASAQRLALVAWPSDLRSAYGNYTRNKSFFCYAAS